MVHTSKRMCSANFDLTTKALRRAWVTESCVTNFIDRTIPCVLWTLDLLYSLSVYHWTKVQINLFVDLFGIYILRRWSGLNHPHGLSQIDRFFSVADSRNYKNPLNVRSSGIESWFQENNKQHFFYQVFDTTNSWYKLHLAFVIP